MHIMTSIEQNQHLIRKFFSLFDTMSIKMRKFAALNKKERTMNKKLFVLFLLSAIVSCSDVKRYNATKEEMSLSIEQSDTMLKYIKGWDIIKSDTYTYCYSKSQDRDGKITEYYTYATARYITNGVDTLLTVADAMSLLNWSGRVFYEKRRELSVEDIKRINTSIRSSCDSLYFTFSANGDHLLTAIFSKEKQKEPERPLEDYGLKESDL